MKIKKVNQQGTLKKDSSETIRVSNFDKKKRFLNWFIGFVEGNENVFMINRRFLWFELNCSLKNQHIIYYIKKMLGFGQIRKIKFLDTIIIEFSVRSNNIVDLLKIIKIFNGNLRCPIKEHYFRLWYNKLKVKLKKLNLLNKLPEYKEYMDNVTILNSWLSGYIDSRVLFYARWHKSKKLIKGKELYLSCIFWHLDKQLLLKIKESLKIESKIEEKKKWNLSFFKIVIEDINEKNRIIEYLLKYKLKSIKFNRYENWKLLLDCENIYINTGFQDFEYIENLLKNFSSSLDEDELNKI